MLAGFRIHHPDYKIPEMDIDQNIFPVICRCVVGKYCGILIYYSLCNLLVAAPFKVHNKKIK